MKIILATSKFENGHWTYKDTEVEPENLKSVLEAEVRQEYSLGDNRIINAVQISIEQVDHSDIDNPKNGRQ